MTPAPSPTTPFDRFLLHPDRLVSDLAHQIAQTVVEAAARFGLRGSAALATLAVGRMALRRWQAHRLAEGGHVVSILVPPEVDTAGAEVLWGTLVALLRPAWRRWLEGQPHITFEYAWTVTGVRLGLWVPRQVPPGMVERAVEAAWPGCRTVTETPAPPIPLGAAATGGTLRLAQPEWYPLRVDHHADPLRALFGAARDLGEGEAAAVQVLARPITGRRLSRGVRAATAMRQGRPMTLTGHLLDLLLPGGTRRPRPAGDPSQTPDIRVIVTKASSPAWEVLVRYAIATADRSARGRQVLRGRAHAVASAFAVHTERNRLRRRRLRRPAQVMAARRMPRGDLLSVPELAQLAHLPLDVAVPGLARAGAKVVTPPPGVPEDGKVLGEAETGRRHRVAIAVPDARYHLHVMGGTGSGKSTLLANLVLGDVEGRRGVVVIDPAGDLITDILDRLPAAAAGRVVLLDPAEKKCPPAMNVLQGTDPELAVDNLVGIFRRIFEAYWGPRTDDVLRAACLTVMRRPGATLADVPRLLSEPEFRRERTAGIDDPVLKGFWSWYEAMTPSLQSQVIGPVMNKLRAFLLRDFTRRVVGNARSTFDMRWVLDGGVCLVRIPKGVLGEETSRLLGSFVVAKVWQAATERARFQQTMRRPASLYVDECQNYLNLPRAFDEMLAEARKYNLSLVLAHQNLAQLPPQLRDALSANARTKVFFTMSPEDASKLERHVAPELTEHDLANLGAYQAAVRLVVDGEERPAFTIRTLNAPATVSGRAALIRQRSRERFGVRYVKTSSSGKGDLGPLNPDSEEPHGRAAEG